MKSSAGPDSETSLILSELEDEIERQLEEKASRNELSVVSVKSLLKAVLTHDDVRKYVECTLNKTKEKPDYKLQLTRAKAKELIDRIPTIAPLLCIPTPQKKSDIDVLINAELSEDSSDEEYQPVDDAVDDEDDAINESTKDFDDLPIASPTCTTALVEESTSLSLSENIGQRTRSKLSLSETPLEAIEQAFIPPDITTDMYNTDCDNQDWLNFLKELVQPLDTLNDGVETNDDENDPEYNVMIDEELEASDNEELRVDRAVKISKKELNNLMSELFEYTQMHEDGLYSDDETNTPEEDNIENLITERVEDTKIHICDEQQELLPQFGEPEKCPNGIDHLQHDGSIIVNQSIACILSSLPAIQPKPEEPMELSPQEKAEFDTLFTWEQYILTKQQIAQHFQLLLQTYLLSCGNPFVDTHIRDTCRKILYHIKELGDTSVYSNLIFSIPTLSSSFELMDQYDKYVDSNAASLIRWNLTIASKESYKKTRLEGGTRIHPDLMKMCLRSCAFQYPLMIPTNGFRKCKETRRVSFSYSEDALIAMALEDCEQNLGLRIDSQRDFMIACDMIRDALLPVKSSSSLMKHILTLKRYSNANVVQDYFITRTAPAVEHFVVPVDGELKPLYLQDNQLIHNSWHKALYEVRHIQKKLISHSKRIKLENDVGAIA